jgi:hypothetical protein
MKKETRSKQLLKGMTNKNNNTRSKRYSVCQELPREVNKDDNDKGLKWEWNSSKRPS